MRLTAITDEISQDFEHALDVLQEYGARAAELRGLWGTNVADLTDAQVDKALRALDQRQMCVAALSTPFYKCDLERAADNPGEAAGPMHLAVPRGLDGQLEMLQRCATIAHRLNTRILRVFTFWRKAALAPDIEEQIAAAFLPAIALAEREDLTLVLENEHACFIGTGAEAAGMLARIGSPRVRACWDPGNAFAAGEQPYPDGYAAVRPWVEHVHVKDGRRVQTQQGEQTRWCVVGQGEVDWRGQLEALSADGYSGYLSLETHYVPEHGSGPNGKGTHEEGSRPCLEYLQHALRPFAEA